MKRASSARPAAPPTVPVGVDASGGAGIVTTVANARGPCRSRRYVPLLMCSSRGSLLLPPDRPGLPATSRLRSAGMSSRSVCCHSPGFLPAHAREPEGPQSRSPRRGWTPPPRGRILHIPLACSANRLRNGLAGSLPAATSPYPPTGTAVAHECRGPRVASPSHCLTRIKVASSSEPWCSRFPSLRASAHPRRWHCGCSVVSARGGRADASGRLTLHATAVSVCDGTCLVVPPNRAGRSLSQGTFRWPVPTWWLSRVPSAAARPWKF